MYSINVYKHINDTAAGTPYYYHIGTHGIRYTVYVYIIAYYIIINMWARGCSSVIVYIIICPPGESICPLAPRRAPDSVLTLITTGARIGKYIPSTYNVS